MYSPKKYEQRVDRFLSSWLKKSRKCEWDSDGIKRVNNNVLNTELNYKFQSGSSMKGVQCFMWDFSRDKIPIMVDSINNGNMEYISEGVEGSVFRLKLDKQSSIILKHSNNNYQKNSVYEYFKGVEAINKLRYIIPNFGYTLGTLKHKRKNYIMYENIQGGTLTDYIKKGLLKPEDYIDIIYQVLLALSVAQKEVKLTHYDLHCENIMLREPPKGLDTHFSYSVNIDSKTYTVKNPKYIATIIDFGLSAVNIKPFGMVGMCGYEHVNIHPRFSAGTDMYHFLVDYLFNIVRFGKNEKIKNIVYNIFRFWGNRDPYSIIKNIKNVIRARQEFSSKGNLPVIGNYTPEELLYYIKLPTPGILITERKEWKPYSISSNLEPNVYFNIISKNEIGKKVSIRQIEKCSKFNSGSLLLLKYYIKVLKDIRYSTNTIEKLEQITRKNGLKMKAHDLKMLNKVETDTSRRSIKDLHEILKRLLNHIDIPYFRENLVNIFMKTKQHTSLPPEVKHDIQTLAIFYNNMQKWVMLYYTILELRLGGEYKQWVEKFKNLENFKFYNSTIIYFNKIIKWTSNGLLV